MKKVSIVTILCVSAFLLMSFLPRAGRYNDNNYRYNNVASAPYHDDYSSEDADEGIYYYPSERNRYYPELQENNDRYVPYHDDYSSEDADEGMYYYPSERRRY